MIYYRIATRAYDNALVITKQLLNNSLNVINNVSRKLKKRIIDQKIIRIKNQNNVRVKFLKQSYKSTRFVRIIRV
jgi:hypothetical protein